MRTFIAVMAALALCLAAGAFAQTYTVLHDFGDGPTDGIEPVGGVVTDGSKLYGVTFRDGQFGLGILYSMNMDGSGYTILRHFGPPPDGVNPNSLPLLNGDILYGTTQSGGAFGRGTIYRIKTDGTAYNSRSFNVLPDGAKPVGPLTMSSDTFYGMCENGGTTDDGTAFSIKTDGTGYTVFHNFAGSPSDGGNPLAGFLLDGGVLYGTTSDGGAYLSGDGTAFSIAPDGSSQKILHSFSFGDGAGISSTLISDGSRLYGTTGIGGSGTSLGFYGGGTVFAVDKDGSNFQTLYNLDFASGGMPGDVVQDGERLFGFAGHGGRGALFNGGVIFTLNIDGTGYTALRQFDNLYQGTGAYPTGTPLLVNGTLYGITDAGGANGEGVVFSYVIPPPTPVPPIDLTVNKTTFQTTDQIGVTANVAAISTPCYPFIRIIQPNGQTIYFADGGKIYPAVTPYLGVRAGPVTVQTPITDFPVLSMPFKGIPTGTYYLEGGAVDATQTTSVNNLIYVGAVDREALVIQ